jgi:hypothetical protein
MGPNAMWSKAGRELARIRTHLVPFQVMVHCRSHRAFHFRQSDLLVCANCWGTERTFAFDITVGAAMVIRVS